MKRRTIRELCIFTTIIATAASAFAAIDTSFGYEMTEDYYEARKQAIQTGKLLFVLSGSASCNWCHETKLYLQRQSGAVREKFVVYYAKRQNNDGLSPFQGGLPQYGTFDPRTVDAFTGTKDADGKFVPANAWYSGVNKAFDSDRGFSESAITRCLNKAKDKTIGRFSHFTLEGPQAVFSDTPTKFRLYAHFSDQVVMEVDHGVKWEVVSGNAEVTDDGHVTVTSGPVKIRAKNEYYDFGVEGEANVMTADLSVVSATDIKNLVITTKSFNLEDDTTVRLRAEAELHNGIKTTAEPEWEVRLDRFVELPADAPLFQQKDGAISLDGHENGRIHYQQYSDVGTGPRYYGINLQDHVLRVKATLGGVTVEEDVTVYGPTRVWPTKWSVVTKDRVAPGSVIRVKVTELKYTYGGQVHTTENTAFAEFQTGYVLNNTGYRIDGVTAVDVPATGNSWTADILPVSVAARKKGGKYAFFDMDERDMSVKVRNLTFCPAEREIVSKKNGIRLNAGWLRIYFPNERDLEALADLDSDDDGFTNAEEFLLGTDPTDANDRWAFTSSHFDWPREVYYRVMFMNHQFPGRIYTIEGAESSTGEWKVLGQADGQLIGQISRQDVATADKCRIFRIKVALKSSSFDSEKATEFVIPGYGVWDGITLYPKESEKYAAFVVDANDLAYPIKVHFDETLTTGKPVFSVPTAQVMKGTLDRFQPTDALVRKGYSFAQETNGIWTAFYATKEPQVRAVVPGEPVVITAATESEALRRGRVAIADKEAVAAGQADVVTIVARNLSDALWTLNAEIAPERMPDGQKIDDTAAAVGRALSSLTLRPQARSATASLTIPAASVTPGLYYSVLYAEGLDFAGATESPRVLATGDDVTLTLPADNAPTRFFRVKASMTSTGE